MCYNVIMKLLQNCYNVFDITEVEHRNVSSIFALQDSRLDYCSGSIAAAQTTDQSKIHYNTVLLQYILTPGKGRGLHFRTSVRLPERAYLMFPHLNPNFEFDTEFDKTLKNQCFSLFQHH